MKRDLVSIWVFFEVAIFAGFDGETPRRNVCLIGKLDILNPG